MILRVVVFYVLAFLFTVVLAVGQETAGIRGENLMLPQWGPALAALATLAAFRRDGLRLTLRFRREEIGRYLTALAIPIVGGLLVLLPLNRLIPGANLQAGILPSLAGLGGMLLGAFGEEVGWRGYLQKMLTRRIRPLVSVVVTGVLWGLWHVSYYPNGLVFMSFLVLTLVGYSLFIWVLIQGTDCNVLVAALFHLSVNVATLMFLSVVQDVRFMMVNGVVWMGLGLILVILRRRAFLAPEGSGSLVFPGRNPHA